MIERPTSLAWWPHDPAKWRTRTVNLSPEARAAYGDLRGHAWLAHSRRERPCTVPADDASLSRIVGMSPAHWRKVAPIVLAFFQRIGELYLEPDLLRTWDEQLAKYNKRATSGGKGGRNSLGKAKRQRTDSNAVIGLKHQDSSSSLREERTTGTDALASDGARAVPPARGGLPRPLTEILAGIPGVDPRTP